MKKLVYILLAVLSTKVQASTTPSDYEEVSYSELVNQLNTQNQTSIKAASAVNDDVYLLGLGYGASFSSFSLNSKSTQKTLGGVRANFGYNLFGPDIFLEGTYIKYQDQKTAESNLSIQDLGAEVNFVNQFQDRTSLRLGGGVGLRFINYASTLEDLNSKIPNFSLHAGVFTKVHKNLQVGADMGARTAFQGNSEDKGSLDMNFRLESIF